MQTVKTRPSTEGYFFIKASAPAFDIYSLNKRKSVLLITAHGEADPADSAPRRPPRMGSPEPRRFAVPAGMVGSDFDSSRASVLRPAAHQFTPHVALTHFSEHAAGLAKEKESTLRLILQGRAVAFETYPPGRTQTDYVLDDVTVSGGGQYGNQLWKRKDLIKAFLLEAELLRVSEAASRALLLQHLGHPHSVMLTVPDVLMVTGSTTLSEVLQHPLVQGLYSRVFCSFCRSLAGQAHPTHHVTRKLGVALGQGEMEAIEARVVKNLREIGLVGAKA